MEVAGPRLPEPGWLWRVRWLAAVRGDLWAVRRLQSGITDVDERRLVYGMGAVDAVQEHQTIEMVQLMQESAGLETFCRYHLTVTTKIHSRYHDALCPSHVSGEVRNTHAPLPGNKRLASFQQLRIEEQDASMSAPCLPMTCHVYNDRTSPHSDLRRCQSDTGGRSPHRVEQVGGQQAFRFPHASTR